MLAERDKSHWTVLATLQATVIAGNRKHEESGSEALKTNQ